MLSCLKAQVNLVPNPSFENLTGYIPALPENPVETAVPWDTIPGGWGGGNVAIVPSPYIVLFGETLYQVARTGQFMVIMDYYQPGVTTNRGYIKSPLIRNLKPNQQYCATAYFNLVNVVRYASDKIGLYFDNGSLQCIAENDAAFTTPQIQSPDGVFYSDTLNWMKLQGVFTATANQSFITIGNFNQLAASNGSIVNGAATHIGASYYIDDVSVLEADLPAFAGRDTVICPGDSIFIGRPPEVGLDCIWTGAVTNPSIAGMWVRPANTQTYMVTQNVCGLIKTDTVKVQVKPKYNGAISLNSNSLTVCPTDTVKLGIANNPAVSGTYNWLPPGVFTHTSNSSANALISQTTDFTLNLNYSGQNAFCPFTRMANVSINVPVYNGSASLTAYPNAACPGDSIVFTLVNAPAGNIKYNWQPTTAYSYTNVSGASAFPGLSNSYTLNVTSPVSNGFCSFTRTISISFSDSCFNDPQIPNIFTPNGDNVNDVWEIKFPYGYSLQEIIVYDRWGTLIYERDNLNFEKQGYARIGWDGYTTSGNQCTAGVYFYVLKYTDRKGNVKNIKGNMTLMK
jgi:gliding motility-associated-like protein